ncbi:xanthine dehydrogenase family protein molybdopterin-binding subunit [Pseudohongiella sp.]|uniref:Aldehyde oxidase/xanthine dehydrogenase a/b hammerhead domain-containing protein n=1 Tax=marine sediment metagenome TaxID=412755 RepID=A0A0F9VSA6_9ZZZZ|nr:molybdopterin cofactor-binding domain-containing protein [Pseudohongiella sp.]HDZ10163.1 xanthine dehydrogenase family protein molybdopterin-binding subunit [Pseudohongiella sp.]HEA64306.1 xanthine dehydrogenase family protein molybdopterin-binding subunit [Pseudohongiella sp.]
MKMNRRLFLLGTTVIGGGLLLGYAVTRPDRQSLANRDHTSAGQSFLTTWLRIDPDNQVTVVVPHSEMGQGVLTSLPMMAADEMDADWNQVRVEQAPATDLFANGVLIKGFAMSMGLTVPAFLDRTVNFATLKAAEIMNMQITGGSSSVRFTGEMGMRAAGAAAREMLINAAAAQWDVAASECDARNSYIYHDASGRSASFGELASAAALFEPPRNPTLKTPDRFTLMGTAVPRVDIPAKVDGSAMYGIDARPDGMLYAAVTTAPVFGGKLTRVDNVDAVMQRRGVERVIELEDAVAVVADNYWRASEALKQLQPVFTGAEFDDVNSSDIFTQFDTALDSAERNEDVHAGDAAEAFAGAAEIIDARYRVPYLAHAAMEPMNCTVHFHDGRCDVWTGTQDNLGIRGRVATVAELNENDVTVHPFYLGGGFGRRLPQSTNTIDQATRIASHFDVPVQTLWSREEDTRQDYYRPAVSSRFRAGLDSNGQLVAWENVYIGKNEPVEAAHIAYQVANQQIDYVESPTHVPFGAWRSVAHSQHSFFLESFTDELAWHAKQDPLQYRLAMLSDKPRHRRVLQEAATRAGWTTPAPEGRARGIALQESFGSIVAEVAEVSLTEDGAVRVNKVVCAIDCGRVVNPDTAASQVESGIIYGLTAAMYGQISIESGRVKESNFHDYEMLRLADSPEIEVILLESDDAAIGGLGEPATPPISAAVTNALYALTGQRVRELPLKHYRFTPTPIEAAGNA